MTKVLVVDGNRSLKALHCPAQLVFTERLWKAGQSWGAAAKSFGLDDTTACGARRIADAGMLVMRDQPDTLAAILSGFASQRLAARK